jgi:hypothetical protein
MAAVVFAAWPLAAHAGPQVDGHSGLYEAMTISVVGDQVTGAFYDQRIGNGTDAAPQFSCIFMLQGKLVGDRADILTWAPGDKDVIHGNLVFTADGADVKLDQEPGGCGMTSGDMVGEPYRASKLSGAEGWLGVAMVSAKKAVFRSEPSAKPGRTPFVVRFDPVVVLERRGDWIRASYVGGEKPVTGWLNRSELDETPPPTGK